MVSSQPLTTTRGLETVSVIMISNKDALQQVYIFWGGFQWCVLEAERNRFDSNTGVLARDVGSLAQWRLQMTRIINSYYTAQ